MVLRDGAMTARAERRDIDLEWIVRHMVGDNYDLGSPPRGHAFGAVALSARDVSVAAGRFTNAEGTTPDGVRVTVGVLPDAEATPEELLEATDEAIAEASAPIVTGEVSTIT